MKIAEVKIVGAGNLDMFVTALHNSGYDTQTGVVWTELPKSEVKYFAVAIFEKE